MMSRTQITLDREVQKRITKRASEQGISFAEYMRRLAARDLAGPEPKANVEMVFNLGSSGGSNVAANKDAMIAEAFEAIRRRSARR
jgi:hypothetical protein